MSSQTPTVGRASPFSQTNNPKMTMLECRQQDLPELTSVNDGQESTDSSGHYYQLAKSLNAYSGYQNLDQSITDLAYPVTVTGPAGKPRTDRGTLLPAPEFGNGSTRSQSASVASSVTSDSPATPNAGENENDRRRKDYTTNVPKLDRTMTDIYGDELYSPNFAITSTPSAQPQLSLSPAENEVFNQRLSAANSHHLSVSHSPVSSNSRDKSPFRTGSPLGPGNMSNTPFNSAQRLREQHQANQEAQALKPRLNGRNNNPDTPKTISPKDALLEYKDSDDDANFSLFPQDTQTNFNLELNKAMVPRPSADLAQQMMVNPAIANASIPAQFMPTPLGAELQVPQQYPFIARDLPHQDMLTNLRSGGSNVSESGVEVSKPAHRPSRRYADGGTYTCTYHGCTMRFETPLLLQKHKREGHRQTQGLGIGQEGVTSTMLNSQAGPHRCDRINPSTGKSCNTVFSRPYDLTRHEDTIHNARKQKVQCDLCSEEKTFSRADALTRHYRVCHPDVEVQGKHGRRNGGT